MSRGLGRADLLGLVAEAGRAPSAHNTQPARWRFFESEGARLHVELYEDTRRRLPVGDPDHRDSRIGLGAAFEGMALALSRRGMALGEPELVTGEPPAEHLLQVAVAEIGTAAGPDPLAGLVGRRHTFRGGFVDAGRQRRRGLRRRLAEYPGVEVVEGEEDLDRLGRLHDRCAVELLADAGYRRELFRWLRFSPRDDGWHRDGLTTDCLPLSRAESLLARLAMRPAVVGALVAVGLGGLVVSEAKAVRSAAAVAVLHRPTGEDPFHAGRWLYRMWLTLCGDGFHLCPMSALADSPRGQHFLRGRFAGTAGRRIVNVLRIGVAPPGPAAEVCGQSRRLPAEELLV